MQNTGQNGALDTIFRVDDDATSGGARALHPDRHFYPADGYFKPQLVVAAVNES
jgi:hypothetical protein